MAPSNKTAPPSGQDAVTTSFLLGNLHCPSCVSTIRDVLQEAGTDHIRWVSPNIVTSVVTVEHDAAISLACMTDALTDAGFDICGVTSSAGETIFDLDTPRLSTSSIAGPSSAIPGTSGSSKDAGDADPKEERAGSSSSQTPSSSWVFSPLSRWMASPRTGHTTATNQERIAQAHLDNCEQCRQNKCHASATPPLETDETDTSEDTVEEPSATTAPPISHKVAKSKDKDINMSEKSFVLVENEDAPASRPTWKANLAVGGMTCAVCVNAITDELKKRDWVTDVMVNLISNSAAVEVDDEARVPQIAEAIEDLGYDAVLDSVTRIDPPKAQQQQNEAEGTAPRNEKRTVEILIQGLYCDHCPDRVTRSLAGFRRASLEVITKPTPLRPLLQVAYVPEAPTFTIRHILAAIEASDGAFAASIYHPPTLEERSKAIRAKHQLQILYRVIFSGIVAIPTFIIGIVYMSLLPSSNHGRMFLMEPWVSGISRAQVALFIMATPVFFFAADVFHVRAFKEIRALWRRGSRTPVLQRFYRFGSMNTLMSLGTTIAYVSSVSQMIAAAANKASSTRDSDFYFDSVVFLTLFLLVGRLIESYSKSRTGDAVEMLGKLRPTTAILMEDGATAGDAQKKAEADVLASPVSPVSSVSSASPDATVTPGHAAGVVVQADQLDFGDVVRVLHGASPPADGVVVQGRTSFDESSLTGESRLVAKAVDDPVYAGTVNQDAPVLVRITGTPGTSMLDQIVAVVREGQTKRAPMEQIADLLTTYFVPVVTLVAVGTWIVWMCLGLAGRIPGHFLDAGSGGWVTFSLQFAISVFVVACPCGLGLAAPTAIFVAGGLAAKYGILAKGGGEAFEKASRIDCVVFDKTGTLTQGGEPTVNDSALYPNEEDSHDDNKNAVLLAALKAVEENSSHPIAKAIVSFCSSHATKPAKGGRVDDLQEIPGRGMRAVYYSGTESSPSFEIIVGNEALLAGYSVAISEPVAALLQQWKSDAKSVALAATKPVGENEEACQKWTLAAALSIADPLRPEAQSILATLQARGVLVYMLSGDNAVTAAAVARQLGIPADQVIAEVLPTEKASQIRMLQASLPAGRTRMGRKRSGAAHPTTTPTGTNSDAPLPAVSGRATVAMVGDGINDAPALTQADVGIAVGSGSDVAIASADFVLVQPGLQAVVTLLALSRVVFRRIAINFGWALVYNMVAVPIAAGALYPIKTSSGAHVRLNAVWASLAMALSSISVVLSSLALRSRVPWVGFRPPVKK